MCDGRHEYMVTCMGSTPTLVLTGSRISGKATSLDVALLAWTHTGEYVAPLLGHTSHVWDVHCCGNIAATASEDKTVRLWDLSTPGAFKCIGTLTEHDRGVLAVTADAKFDRIATAGACFLFSVSDVQPKRRCCSGNPLLLTVFLYWLLQPPFRPRQSHSHVRRNHTPAVVPFG